MKPEFEATFSILRGILKKHEPKLVVEADTAENYCLNTAKDGPNRKPLFFGAARAGKNYVSFHLMPVYIYPDLLDGVSPGLKKRMQGKSCFNFKAITKDEARELEQLTRRSAARLKSEGLL